jgi:acyl-CoA thioester hydrolase
MFTSKAQIRIHYAWTDQMGLVYYGNYAQLYEIGRTEALRGLGLTYKEIEATGVIMPVTEMHIRFLRPALYDDLVTVVTTIKEMPLHSKIIFHNEVYNEKEELLNMGSVTLYFINAKTMKRTDIPEKIKKKLLRYFETKKES